MVHLEPLKEIVLLDRKIERDVGDIQNNLMKLGGSLGNVPQKMKNLL
jgi:hypothetical protein